ncbi:P-loop containing nucleoside triphosphate hydrolase protein [Naviculisporaceae sp. PSN 640]
MDGRTRSSFSYAERTESLDQLEDNHYYYPEIKVLDIDPDWAGFLESVAPKARERCEIKDGAQNHVTIAIRLHLSRTTYNAETGALAEIQKSRTKTSGLRKSLFENLVLLRDPRFAVNLNEMYPHMFDLNHIKSQNLRAKLLELYENFDSHQCEAYKKLVNIPEGVLFLPGAAGSGKTRWCLSVTAMAQASNPSAKVLYLLDVNKSLDDGARNMVRLYKDLGMEKKVIRMLKWPREIRKGQERDANKAMVDADDDPTRPDFRWAFYEQWKRSSAASNALLNDPYRAPTLDEAACQYFRAHQHTAKFRLIRSFLNMGDIKPYDWDESEKLAFKESRSLIEEVYRAVLQEADFIATTPVAAFCHFHGMFNPDLIFFDESAHARELSTLIPISFFSPKAWFFVGDWRQTSPYVECKHQECAQLHLSLLERVDRVVGISCQLFTNHRSLGGLHALPSELFYGSRMTSAQMDGHVPDSLEYLRTYFLGLRKTESRIMLESTVPRFVVDLGEEEEELENSFWNEFNHVWVMERVHELLADPRFLQPDSSTPGTILLVSPYRTSFQRYRSAVDEQIHDPKKRVRVDVRTLGTAQGAEADVVFIDMVKSRASDFSDDSKRLCVALTRARQAEVIMMNRGMAYDNKMSVNLPLIYDGCISGNHGTLIQYEDLENTDIFLPLHEQRLEEQLARARISKAKVSTAVVSPDPVDRPKNLLFSTEAVFKNSFILL